MSEDAIKTNGFNKTKVQAAKKEWEKLQADFDKTVSDLKDDLGEAIDGILERMETLGIKRSVFKAMMTEDKLRKKADAIRGRFAEDGDVQDQFDNVRIAAGMNLFDAAGVEAPKAENPKPKGSGKKPPSKTGDKAKPKAEEPETTQATLEGGAKEPMFQ